ncbi:Methyltransferase domain-containing protein [Devosia enhydra]|uniref:Methyltransferase domain-containing protein n=1 Tax=Devosia enhydra TaxID=665118 RepID=A0A1K2I0P4_9HYPH|nr:methyltransferase domain-containing protein [Devosia enhydra]SFZ85942.1 Methyltransferase domain-containing protein [Devosia enhydra]
MVSLIPINIGRALRRGFDYIQNRPSTTPNYGICAGYRHRNNNKYFDDIQNEDEFQNEVYDKAKSLLIELGGNSVIDIGCGSGFKLLKFFSDFQTIGIDLPPTVNKLIEMHPERDWRSYSFKERPALKCDVLICADVIEHIPDPTDLISFILSIEFKTAVISTPERDLVYGRPHNGPPNNYAHCREWNMHELTIFLAEYFTVDSIYISNFAQATQAAILRKRQ